MLTTGMLGVFIALDLFLFYVMWEVMLIPMYFIIGIWGGERRHLRQPQVLHLHDGRLAADARGDRVPRSGRPRAGHRASRSSRTTTCCANARSRRPAALWLFAAFSLAFAVKVPMFPFHTWLPDAHVEAPTAGSVVLAGIMLKLGTYGFLRFAVPFFPAAAMQPDACAPSILVLAVIGIIYGALVALVQPDFKKLVAYSSVSHLGFVMLGIFALTVQSVQGALMVMINHGISTGALFFLIGMIYERRHTRLIDDVRRHRAGGADVRGACSRSSRSAASALPGTNGFVGEFLVLIGCVQDAPGARRRSPRPA